MFTHEINILYVNFISVKTYLYICVYIYTHTHTHTHTYIYIYIFTHTHKDKEKKKKKGWGWCSVSFPTYSRLKSYHHSPSYPSFAVSINFPEPTFWVTFSCPLCHSLTQTFSISYLNYHIGLLVSLSFPSLSLLIRVVFLKPISAYRWLTLLFQLIANIHRLNPVLAWTTHLSHLLILIAVLPCSHSSFDVLPPWSCRNTPSAPLPHPSELFVLMFDLGQDLSVKSAVTYALVVTEKGYLIPTLINKQHDSKQTFKEILWMWDFEIDTCIIFVVFFFFFFF